MRTVIFVPGFSASELFLDAHRSRLYWVDYSRIALLTPGVMRLDRRGILPGGPDGKPLFPGEVITTGYPSLAMLLTLQLAPKGYFLRSHGWDWRKDIWDAGSELAFRCLRESSRDEPVTLIGHSAGGLVCRAAWEALVSQGLESRIRRIITLGTPHYGTYYALSQWAGIGDWIAQLNFLGQTMGGLGGSLAVVVAGRMTVGQLVDVALTFPSLYQLLPVVGAPDNVLDPHRSLLFGEIPWKGLAANINMDHLRILCPRVHEWQLDPATRPPPHVMTVVTGNGVPTPFGLTRPDRLGFSQAIGSTPEGDGVVTWDSAEGDFPVEYTVYAGHSDLPRVTVESGLLATLVTDERSPGDPLPPPVVDTAVKVLTDGIPPLGVTEARVSGQAPCVGESCNC